MTSRSQLLRIRGALLYEETSTPYTRSNLSMASQIDREVRFVTFSCEIWGYHGSEQDIYIYIYIYIYIGCVLTWSSVSKYLRHLLHARLALLHWRWKEKFSPRRWQLSTRLILAHPRRQKSSDFSNVLLIISTVEFPRNNHIDSADNSCGLYPAQISVETPTFLNEIYSGSFSVPLGKRLYRTWKQATTTS
jgi:hypothetical protein